MFWQQNFLLSCHRAIPCMLLHIRAPSFPGCLCSGHDGVCKRESSFVFDGPSSFRALMPRFCPAPRQPLQANIGLSVLQRHFEKHVCRGCSVYGCWQWQQGNNLSILCHDMVCVLTVVSWHHLTICETLRARSDPCVCLFPGSTLAP